MIIMILSLRFQSRYQSVKCWFQVALTNFRLGMQESCKLRQCPQLNERKLNQSALSHTIGQG